MKVCTCLVWAQSLEDTAPCPVHGEERSQTVIARRARLEHSRAGVCPECGEHEGTMPFTQNGGALDFAHGFFENWCEHCVVRAQLEYARNAADRIPELEKRLEELSS